MSWMQMKSGWRKTVPKSDCREQSDDCRGSSSHRFSSLILLSPISSNMHSVFIVCSLVLLKKFYCESWRRILFFGEVIYFCMLVLWQVFFQLTSCIIWDSIKQRLLSGFFFLWYRFHKICIIRLKNGKTLKWSFEIYFLSWDATFPVISLNILPFIHYQPNASYSH